MPFLLGVAPLVASALGTTLPTALAIGLPAAAGALGMASGIARGDPLAAAMGAAEGAFGGLGGAGVFSGLGGVSAGAQAGKVAGEAAQAAAQGSTTAAPIITAGESAASAIAPATQIGEMAAKAPTSLMDSINAGLKTTIDSSKPLEAVAPLTWGGESPQSAFLPGGSSIPQNLGKNMGIADAIGMGLQGASAATQGVMGLIDSFRDKSKGTRMNFGAINNYLPAMQSGQLSSLPQAPQFEGGVTRTPLNIELDRNQMFYDLMNSFVG